MQKGGLSYYADMAQQRVRDILDSQEDDRLATLSNPDNTGVDTSDLHAHYRTNGTIATPNNSDAATEWYYKKQEAELNHRYAIDAWERQVAEDDPTNIYNKYKKAMVNPRVAFGAGVGTGASIDAGSASGSYDKSDRTQAIENVASIGGLVNDSVGTLFGVSADIGGLFNLAADTDLKQADVVGKQIDNRFKEQKNVTQLGVMRADIADKLAKADLSSSQKEYYTKQLDWIDQQIAESKKNVESSDQNIKESKQRVKESEKRVGKLEEDTKLTQAITKLKEDQLETQRLDRLLKEAQTSTEKQKAEHYKALVTHINKEVDLLGKELDLKDEQIRQIQHAIWQRWMQVGTYAAKSTSSEIRDWIGHFMTKGLSSLGRKSGNNTDNIPQMWDDIISFNNF